MFRNILIFLIILLALLAGGFYTWTLYNQKEALTVSLANAKKTQQDVQEESQRLVEKNEDLQKQLDRIQADVLTYVATNTKLQLEKEDLQKKIAEVEQEIKRREELLAGIKTHNVPGNQGQGLPNLQKEIEKLKLENQAAQEKLKATEVNINLLNTSQQRERAVLEYNLGVAFSQAKQYDEAVAAFEKSLQLNSNNPQAHYNLALIFENIKLNYPKAIWHYERYLDQSTDASDREEVTAWIRKLK